MPATRSAKRTSELYASNRTHTNYDTPTKATLREAVTGLERRNPIPTTPAKQVIYK